MSEIQRLPPMMNPNPVHPNAKTTTQITNGTTTTKTNIGSPVCRNCKTQTTPLWRRDETGQVLCNACGLFLKLHGRPRPISLKTDTIKSRNRIKQPNFSKSSGPNTPELKSKDAKVSIQPNMGISFQNNAGQHHQNGISGTHTGPPTGRHSPLSAGKRPSPPDSVYATSSQIHSPIQHPVRQAPFSGGVYPSGINGFHHAGLPHQVQSLHYPSSTPTQFAPGLQRITSPLLLSTTPSVSNARSSGGIASKHPAAAAMSSPQSSLTAMQAAGALENMSNELGPSASFKNSNSSSSSSATGISLLSNSVLRTRPDSSMSNTPTSALSNSPKPQLPALGSNHDIKESVVPSPSFGPQFSLHDNSKPLETPLPSLPPLKHMSGTHVHTQLPHLTSNLGSGSYSAASTPEKVGTPVKQEAQQSQIAQEQTFSMPAQMNPGADANTQGPQGSIQQLSGSNAPSSEQQSGANLGSGQGSGPGRSSTGDASQTGRSGGQEQQDRGSHNNNNNNNNGNGHGGGSGSSANNTYEVNVLKTRISELELVNDLYRTRIMELEAMEQAARLRENSMRKRLDDVLRAQGYEDSSSILTSTMKVVKRDESFDEGHAKRQKTG